MKEQKLVFLISQPRAGSTFLQNLLSNNKSVNTTSEPWVLLNFAQIMNYNAISAGFNQHLAKSAFDEYLSKYPDFEFSDRFRRLILDIYEPLSIGYQYVLDKTPRYWELVHGIRKYFPKSRIIVLIRNPIDVARSMMKTWQLHDLAQINHYRRDLLKAPVVLDEYLQMHGDDELTQVVHYEELRSNTELVTRNLYNWLEIEFDPNVMDISKNHKVKGSFGDPYQNLKDQSNYAEGSKTFKLTNTHEEFLSGYGHYLSSKNLSYYSGYDLSTYTDHRVFRDFLKLGEYHYRTGEEIQTIETLQNELSSIEEQIVTVRASANFRLGKFLLQPIRQLKKLLT